jgi:type IV pilus assembly protein PilX
MALVSSMLLLLIITILAVTMMRSFTTQEKIAGNVREKERALHAAESAEQYAEWYLTAGNNLQTGAVTCGGGAPLLNANITNEVGQICSNGLASLGILDPAQVPWIEGGVNGGPVGVSWLPTGMTIGVGWTNATLNYFSTPTFYIEDRGKAADGQGEAYVIDAVGYGGSANAVAVVESAYEVTKGVSNLGGL